MENEHTAAMMAALEQIQEILGSVKGIQKPGEEEPKAEAALETLADETPEEDAAEGEKDPLDALGGMSEEGGEEPPPERFLSHPGSPSEPSKLSIDVVAQKRGPGRPKKGF